MKRIAQATVHSCGDIHLVLPYNRPFIEQLEIEVPAYARGYDSETKSWLVDAAYAPWVIHLCRQHFPNGRIDRGEPARAEPRRESGLSSVYSMLHLLPDAPPELGTGAYWILAKIHHPDRGGNAVRMGQINAAHAKIGAT